MDNVSESAASELLAAAPPRPWFMTGSRCVRFRRDDGLEPAIFQVYSQADGAPELIVRAVNEYEALRAGLEELLSVAERMRGGDPKLDPEEYYAIRDYARKVLNGNT